MKYIDSNLFIYAALYSDERGEKARNFIKKVRKGDREAVTSALTFDEVFWKVRKEKDFESALEIGKSFLEMENLTFVEVDDNILRKAYNLIKKYKLDPRDAIHMACALKKGSNTIISEDEDFDRIKKINREWII